MNLGGQNKFRIAGGGGQALSEIFRIFEFFFFLKASLMNNGHRKRKDAAKYRAVKNYQPSTIKLPLRLKIEHVKNLQKF